MTEVLEQIEAKLAELPDDPDEIARKFRNEGIKGDSCGGNCPVYHWLHEQIPDVSWVTTGVVMTGDPNDPENRSGVPLPYPVEQFVRCFDFGRYPWLVELP